MLKKTLALLGLIMISFITLTGCAQNTQEPTANKPLVEKTSTYYFPHEGDEHEGTWLQWPHDNTHKGSIDAYEEIWIEMTRALIKGENVHLVVYDENEKNRVIDVLNREEISMDRIDFFVFPTDDVWVRDNGPIFVYDEDGELLIENWIFNGWGNKMPYKNDTEIPVKISEALGIDRIDIPMVMEGGALELDGKGTVISTLSCVNNDNRTADYTLDEIEEHLSKYYGVTNFIWLDGVAGMDITDNHIDGMIKFLDHKTIIAAPELNEDPETTEDEDTRKLLTSKNAFGEPYKFVFMPETKETVVQVENEWIKGAYLNFYVGNAVVLVPNYDDPNDEKANNILRELYPDKEIVGIDVRNLYADGGIIHCVTQQQPINKKNP